MILTWKITNNNTLKFTPESPKIIPLKVRLMDQSIILRTQYHLKLEAIHSKLKLLDIKILTSG